MFVVSRIKFLRPTANESSPFSSVVASWPNKDGKREYTYTDMLGT